MDGWLEKEAARQTVHQSDYYEIMRPIRGMFLGIPWLGWREPGWREGFLTSVLDHFERTHRGDVKASLFYREEALRKFLKTLYVVEMNKA